MLYIDKTEMLKKKIYLREIENLFFAWREYLKEIKILRFLFSFLFTLFILFFLISIFFWIKESVYANVDKEATEKTLGALIIGNYGIKIFLLSLIINWARLRYLLFKRIFDLVISGIGLLLLSPLFLIIAFLIKVDSSGPVFFRQERVGENGRIFKIWKFRTMRENAEAQTGPVWAQEDDPRITRIGRFLRKSHLDELPQLINVFKGEMSLIGPRPERPELYKKIIQVIPHFSERLKVKPGITGLAQVRYQYGASLKDAARKLRYDLLYIKRRCWLLDFQIILWTINRILTGEGAH
ncbi:MAG: hypothetical protein B6D55_02885 [Candidatus Omnitrophica bacterium 4484_70.2]|nr:MAG: hypothetical protein B6D55_02885 [Candidatus Omnitrophica bacterium 4484_70.2]